MRNCQRAVKKTIMTGFGKESVSGAFLWRRIHSLMGLWLVVFLILHLTVNSQVTLWLGEDGIGFIRLSNLLESLPYLQVIETIFLGVPFALHMVWGVRRIFQAKINSVPSNGSSPSLPYGRNRAFTWQRLSSWILLFGLIAHVVQMRFVESPKKIENANGTVQYWVYVSADEGLESISKRLDVTLEKQGEKIKAIASSPGKAMLMMVRETFKSTPLSILYTIFVLAASFHAFNGLWTAMITWGALLSYRSQKAILPLCWVGVALLSFLGLAAIWGSYWINLRA